MSTDSARTEHPDPDRCPYWLDRSRGALPEPRQVFDCPLTAGTDRRVNLNAQAGSPVPQLPAEEGELITRETGAPAVPPLRSLTENESPRSDGLGVFAKVGPVVHYIRCDRCGRGRGV